MKKRILIIGANSAFAKDVAAVLAKDNTIITAGRKGCDVYCDVTRDIDIPSGIDTVINFAADFGGTSDEEILKTLDTNLLGILRICVGAKAASVSHIVSISSMSAVLNASSPYYSIYSITKKHADELTQFYCKLNEIPLTIIRPTQIYGDSNSFAKHQPLFYQFIDRAQNGDDISIYGENDALRNYIHSADLSETINRVVEKRIEGVYSGMHPTDITYSQIAHTSQKVFGKGGNVVFLKDKPNIPDNVFKKDLGVYEKTGYFPEISIEAGIARIKKHRERGLK